MQRPCFIHEGACLPLRITAEQREKRKKNVRWICLAAFIVAAIALTIAFIPVFRSLGSEQARLQFKQHVEQLGIWGWLMMLGIQVLQVIVALIPGEPVEVLSGVLYGGWGGLATCLLGISIGSWVIFSLVRWFGQSLVEAMLESEKMQKLSFLRKEKNLDMLVFVLFLIPGTPKDALTYFVPLTRMKRGRFIVLSTIARIPSIITSTFAGHTLGDGNWWMTALFFLLAAGLGIAGIVLQNRLMQRYHAKHPGNKNKTDQIG